MNRNMEEWSRDRERAGGWEAERGRGGGAMVQQEALTLTPVRAAPQVSDYFVDLIHFHTMKLHDSSGKQNGHKNRIKNRTRQYRLMLKGQGKSTLAIAYPHNIEF